LWQDDLSLSAEDSGAIGKPSKAGPESVDSLDHRHAILTISRDTRERQKSIHGTGLTDDPTRYQWGWRDSKDSWNIRAYNGHSALSRHKIVPQIATIVEKLAMKFINNAAEEVYSQGDRDSTAERSTADDIQVPGYDASLQYDDQEARRAVRKVDIFILPFIVLLFCFLQFDRTNVANALTDTIRTDIHVGNTQINLATTLFTLGFVITELPFNMISKVVGPERFLPFTMLLWGTATAAQASLKGASGLYAARFMIGALGE
jgi:hypothetical protein